MKRIIGLPRLVWVLPVLLLAVLAGLLMRPQEAEPEPDDAAAAHAALQAGDVTAASALFGELLLREPDRSDLWEPAGRAALASGDAGLAIDRLTKAETLGAISAEGYLALGDALRLAGEWQEALDAWSRALELGAEPVVAYRRLLVGHQALGDYRSAIEDLQALVAIESDDPETHFRLGLLQAALEPWAALGPLQRAVELDPRLGDTVQQLEQGLVIDPAGDDPALRYFNAGRALAGLGEWPLAAEAFRQALVANPAYAEAWAFLGESMVQLGMDGSRMFETALEVNPDSLTANLLYALQLRRAGDLEAALAVLTTAAGVHPEEPVVFAEIAQAYADQGKVNDALSNFSKAVELAPDEPAFLHLLAMYSIFNEIQVDEIGLPAARAAVLLDDSDPVALDLIGYAYYLQGDWVSGLRFIHRSLTADPGYAFARLHLGMLYLARQQNGAAIDQLELTLRIAPGSPAAEQAELILEKIR